MKHRNSNLYFVVPYVAAMLLLLGVACANATGSNHHNHDIDVLNKNYNYNTDYDQSHFDNDTRFSNYNLHLPNVSTDGYGDGVYCDKPTLGGGIFGDEDNVGAFIGITFSLGGKNCDDLARMKIIEQEMRMIELCNRLHKTDWVDQDSRVHSTCDKYVPTHGHPPGSRANNGTRRVSPHH